MKLTPGKLAGLKKVSNERGIIAAAAMDQRGSLQKSLAKEKGAEISDAMMEEFKISSQRGSHPARHRHPARPRMGTPRLQAPRQERRPAARL